MDSNHRSPARKSRFLLRKANCGTERGQQKKVVSYAVPMVRIHLPPAGSLVRTSLVETHGFEHVDRAVAAGRRMIVFSGHIANWEIAMLAGIQYGIPVAQIYRAGNNPLLDRLIAGFAAIGAS
jgi:lauroyl/myristoyl acyltransferase